MPDLPGCVATGDTEAAVEQEIRAAIAFHIVGLREDGLAVPLSFILRAAPVYPLLGPPRAV